MKVKLLDLGRGFGGSTCARYLQRFNNSIDITLIEASDRYISCPFSNTVISGMQQMDSITHDYSAHKNRGVKVIHAMAQDVDPAGINVILDNGDVLAYDRLVLAPGIDFKWEDVEGMSVEMWSISYLRKKPELWPIVPA